MIPTGFVVSFCSILTSYCEPLGVTRRLWSTVGVRRRIDEKTNYLILCVYSSQPTSVGKQLDRGTEVENPCVLTFTSVSR